MRGRTSEKPTVEMVIAVMYSDSLNAQPSMAR